MPANFIRPWLKDLNYPRSGVGDLEDLSFFVGVGSKGRWLGFVNPGWYYHKSLELYHYIAEGNITTAIPPGSSVITHSISFRPAWGPILIYGQDNELYEPIYPVLFPAMPATWIQVAGTQDLYVTTIPSGAELVGVRDLQPIALGEVAASGELISDRFFYVDEVNRKVYTRSSTSPVKKYLDLLYSAPLGIRYREVVTLGKEGLLPSYRLIENVEVRRGDFTQTISGPISGYIVPSGTGFVYGDWFTLEYNVVKSYTVRDHKTIYIYSTAASGDDVSVSFETSIPDLIPPLTLSGVASGLLDLNPFNPTSHRTGVLFHYSLTPPPSSLYEASTIRVDVDRSVMIREWKDFAKFTALALDESGLPIPWQRATLTLSPGTELLVTTPAATGSGTTYSVMFDGRGELHGCIRPGIALTSETTITVYTGFATGAATISMVSTGDVLSGGGYQKGGIALVLLTTGVEEDAVTAGLQQGDATNQVFGPPDVITDFGLASLAGGPIYLDGIPREAIYRILADSGVDFRLGEDLSSKEVEVAIRKTVENPEGIANVEVLLGKGGARISALADDGGQALREVRIL